MPDYRFSRRAALDLEAIAEYTIERFGIEQSRRYRDELAACFDQYRMEATRHIW
jgi:toxin ParE1/3/4